MIIDDLWGSSPRKLNEHGGGIGPKQHWQKLMPKESTVDTMAHDAAWDDEHESPLAESGPHFIARQNGLILWQLGHYHYVITGGTQPWEVVKACPDCSAEEAQEIMSQLGDFDHDGDWDEVSDERAGPVSKKDWQKYWHRGVEESDRLDERAGPVSVIRWGKPWLSAGRDGLKATPPVYNTDYTQDNPNFQSAAHDSELETFYDYENNPEGGSGEFKYPIELSRDDQGTPVPRDTSELSTYKYPESQEVYYIKPDPEAPGSSGAWDDDTEDTDEEMFSQTMDRKSSKEIYRVTEHMAQISPRVFMDYSDSEINRAVRRVTRDYGGKKLSESDRGIIARRVIKILKS